MADNNEIFKNGLYKGFQNSNIEKEIQVLY